MSGGKVLDTLPKSAAVLALLGAGTALLLGGGALVLGITGSSTALWAFGAASLLQVAPALSLHSRIRSGLGNRGLDRERRILRATSHLFRLLALGTALASLAALMGHQAPDPNRGSIGFALLALGLHGALWHRKGQLAEVHPALAMDAARSRTMAELATLLFLAALILWWLPQADAVLALIIALRLFLEGRSLAKDTSVAAACGGCGSGCGCG